MKALAHQVKTLVFCKNNSAVSLTIQLKKTGGFQKLSRNDALFSFIRNLKNKWLIYLLVMFDLMTVRYRINNKCSLVFVQYQCYSPQNKIYCRTVLTKALPFKHFFCQVNEKNDFGSDKQKSLSPVCNFVNRAAMGRARFLIYP